MTRLRGMRKLVGISTKELADRSGISYRTILHYETRERDINKAKVETVIKLANALGCDVSDLIEPI